MTPALLADLARAKAIFQQRAILAAMGVNPDSGVPIVGPRGVEVLRFVACDDAGKPVVGHAAHGDAGGVA